MALTPFGFAMDPFFGPSSRDLRALNKAIDGWTSALMPAFEQLPAQQAASTAMVSEGTADLAHQSCMIFKPAHLKQQAVPVPAAHILCYCHGE